MKTKTILSLLFVCVIFPPLCAQQNQKLDSLLKAYAGQSDDTLKVNTIQDISYTYLYIDPEKSLEYAIEGQELSNKLNYKFGQGLSSLNQGTANAVLGNEDSARFFWEEAMKIFKQLNKHALVGRTNRNLAILGYETGNYKIALGHIDKSIAIFSEKINDSLSLANSFDTKSKIHIYQGNYRMALSPAIKSLAILEKIDAPIWKAHALNNLGIIEFYNSNYAKSIEYNEQALKIYNADNIKWWEAQALNDIGNCYYYLNNFEKASEILNKCVSIATEVDNTSVKGTALNNLGKTYIKQKKYTEAISNLNASLSIAKDRDHKNKIVECLNDLGNAYFESGNVNQSIELYSRAIYLADSIGSKGNLKNGFRFRSKALARQGNFEKAYLDSELLRVVNDSLYNTTKSQQIQELLTIYETEKKEQQIALQEKEITVLEQKAEISTLQKILLGGLLVISLIGFYGIKQKVKRNKLEKEKVDAELAYKKKELTTHALHLAKKNEVLESVKQKVKELKMEENSHGYQQLITTINFDQQDDKNWESFTQYFEQVHKDFSSNVNARYPEITKNELRFMALLKMNMSSKEIATMLNISTDGIKKARQRLRKKMHLSPEESLENAVITI